VFGVGCTASLVTDRPKRGEHRFHISIHAGEQIQTTSLTLIKGARDRVGEEAVLDAVLLNALAQALGLAERLDPALLPGEEMHQDTQPVPDPLLQLLRGDIPYLCVEADGRLRPDAPRPQLLLSGAFNPVHAGHFRLGETATRLTGLPAAYELSIANVDKPPLTAEVIRQRLPQFTWHAPLWLTRAPTFVEKATLFPGVVFVVGLDTAERILAPRYYQNSEPQMRAALERIRAHGCRFLVAGRHDQGQFRTLDHLTLPEGFHDLFAAVSEADFRADLSSTQLRQQAEPHKSG
jgi:hypothetical protein